MDHVSEKTPQKAANGKQPGSLQAATMAEIRALMAKRRWSFNRLAAESGVNIKTLRRIDANERALDVDQLDKLCNALGVCPADLVTTAKALAVNDQAV